MSASSNCLAASAVHESVDTTSSRHSPSAARSTAVSARLTRVEPGESDASHHLDGKTPERHTAGVNGTDKIAVSLPKGVADRVRRAVRQGRAPSVSAYFVAALEEKAKLDELAVLLDEMLAESGGPLSPAERRAADHLLGVSAKTRRG